MLKRVLQHTFSLLHADHVKLTSRWNYHGVISPYHRIYLIDEGDGEISDQYNAIKLEPGQLYMIPSFTLCNLSCSAHLSQYFVQFFEESADGVSLFAQVRKILKTEAMPLDSSLFIRLLKINPQRGINRSDDPRIYEKNTIYNECQALNNEQSIAGYLETQGLLLQLLARFLDPPPSKRKEVLASSKIAETVQYILINLEQDLSVETLAARINLHPDYFSRQFKSHTGERPVTYVNTKRIERAQHLLATTRMAHLAIATQTGFDSLSYFSKSFKKGTGLSPRAYKKQLYKVGLSF